MGPRTAEQFRDLVSRSAQEIDALLTPILDQGGSAKVSFTGELFVSEI